MIKPAIIGEASLVNPTNSAKEFLTESLKLTAAAGSGQHRNSRTTPQALAQAE
jgi:hypothetical protein